MATAPLSNLTALWNSIGTTFSAIKMNVTDTASAAASLLMDLQVGGVSQFRVSKGGQVTALSRATIDGLTVGKGGQTAVSGNTAVGVSALNSASLTGASNTALGQDALTATSTGAENTAIGWGALVSNASGSQNVAVGYYGLALTSTGINNTAVGYLAGFSNAAGEGNVAIGRSAGRRVNTSRNTAVGTDALLGGSETVANNTGDQNVAIGWNAGNAITSGSTNVAIGYDVDVDSATGSNQINIADRYFHDRIRLLERTSDPAKPAEGNCIVWMSDGTGLGDDGDVIISSTAGGVTNYAILFDHSAGTLWP